MAKIFTCGCGYQWKEGRNGSHNCAEGYRERLVQALKLLSSLVDLDEVDRITIDSPEGHEEMVRILSVAKSIIPKT